MVDPDNRIYCRSRACAGQLTSFRVNYGVAGRAAATEYASTFGFYEYRARAYNPTLGRFMSEDPKLFVRRIGLGKSPDNWSFSAHLDQGEFNLFRYCSNDPLDKTDPMGLSEIDIEITRTESVIQAHPREFLKRRWETLK